MSPSYHTEAREIAGRLEQAGLAADARTLVDAIDAGSTGTEILMALRWQLRRIDESRSHLDADIRARIRALASAIDRALGG
jgi:hypothetical protein